MAECLLNIDKLYDKKLQFKDYLKKLINYLKSGVVNNVSVDNMIFVLKLMEKILENEKKNLTEMQNLFDQLEATKMFLNLVSDIKTNPFNDNLLTALLSFMTKLTEGGNVKV